MDAVLDRLLQQAYLFDDPAAYEAGVRDAVEAIDARDEAVDEPRRAAMAEHPAAGVRPRLQAVEPTIDHAVA